MLGGGRIITMARRRHTPEQIIRKLREADRQFDVTAAGRTIKILHVVDEFTRESLSDLAAYSIDADATVAVLDMIASTRRGFPEFIRCDNGPELTANALPDWCRFTGTGTSYIEAGSPWENPWVEGSRRAGRHPGRGTNQSATQPTRLTGPIGQSTILSNL
jgi:hypothetical protein